MSSISVIFVLSDGLVDESEASDIMIQAYEACRQNEVKSSWIAEKEIYKSELKKTDFIVFDSFEGKEFEPILSKKSASVIGPWCLLVCLMDGKKIPNFQWPIYNVAFYNCIVTSSHLSKSDKLCINKKVRTMGGYYSDSLNVKTTHIVAGSVKTAKYMNAIEMNIKVMTPPWIDAVWNKSQDSNTHCDNSEFNKYKIPALYNLSISSTGITDPKEREMVQKLIKENGGTFTGKLDMRNTDFLLCSGENISSSVKFKEARKKDRIYCVTLDWLYDSVKCGFCLPHEKYTIKKETSTPLKDNYMNPNFSTMSAINQSRADFTSLEDSMMPPKSSTSGGIKRKVFGEYDDLIEKLDVKRARRSGQFLDGCSVYLVGFRDEHRDKLCKIINISGATRCDDMSDRVTHVIVGDIECLELKLIKEKDYSCSFVNPRWLSDSIEKARPCLEDQYLIHSEIEHTDVRSPLGKKGLSLLISNKTITQEDLSNINAEKNQDDNVQKQPAEMEIPFPPISIGGTLEDDTLANFLKQGNFDSKQLDAAPSQASALESGQESDFTLSQDDQSSQAIFAGMKFMIIGFDELPVEELKEYIENCSGNITETLREASHIVLPSFIASPIEDTEQTVITDMWICDCVNSGQLKAIEYFHRPICVKNDSALKDLVISISGYSGYERNFLSSLVEHLGATFQELFSRVTSTEKNLMASTHLVTVEASGKKYDAARKWGVPAMGIDWLMESAKNGRKMDEQDYLIDKAKKVTETAPFNVHHNKENQSAGNSRTYATLYRTETPKGTTGSTDTPSASIKRQSSSEANNDDLFSVAVNIAGGSTSDSAKGTNTDKISGTSSRGDDTLKNENHKDDSFEIAPLRKFQSRRFRSDCATPEGAADPCSQVTPVAKIMQQVRMTNLLGTPETPQWPRAPWEVDTPDTPLGLCITPNPSRSLRKAMLQFLNQFPDKKTPPTRRLSTPLSELKRRLIDKIGSSVTQSQSEIAAVAADDNSQEREDEKESETQSALVNERLQQLQEMVAAAGDSASKSRRQSRIGPSVSAHEVYMKESQPCTVRWDFGGDTQEDPPSMPNRHFMISGVTDVDHKESMVSRLEDLGATVWMQTNYDPNSTHLICVKPGRNEKTLSCMASGKWILHTNYVDACEKAGKFVDEEEYEFGNPNSIGKIQVEIDRDNELRMQAIYHWRNEIARTGKKPFEDMRAIIVAEKKGALVSVIEAGGGKVVDAQPPYSGVVHATHCLIELKSAINLSLFEPLARQGIYCVNTVYISDFLHRTSKDIKDSVLPHFQKYFK